MQRESSFDGTEHIDLTSIITEFPDNLADDFQGHKIPVKKLSQMFDNCCAKESSASSTSNGMKVYLRVRAIPEKLESTITVDSNTTIITSAPESSKRAQYSKKEERHYAFSHVFAPTAQQSNVFDVSVSPLLDKLMQGESAVLFAYGMTNAGKTFTIQGSSQHPGILPRLVNAILEQSKGLSDGAAPQLHISMLEIYQEKIFDLLSTKREKLSIRDANGKVEVSKLSAHAITSDEEAMKLLHSAATNRSRANTLLNSGSSRSHAVYSLCLTRNINGKETSTVFQLVDLAGAERGNRTKAGYAQQREANNINTSLMTLWRCLQNMKKKSNDTSSDIIPFRESKLTHLLMPQLCRAGVSSVAMIACVNPQADDYDETLSVLGNASLASKIKEISDLGRTGAFPTIARSASSSSDDDLQGVPTVGESNHVVSGAPAAGTVSTLVAAFSKTSRPPLVHQASEKKRKFDSTLGARKASLMDGFHEDRKSSVETDGSMSEIKRLRLDVERLEEENRQLQIDQFQRETEIRAEVSAEMAERGAFLLEQMQALQDQLMEQQERNDVTKSVKKLRQQQSAIQTHDLTKDLKEAEEEIERLKQEHSKELSATQADKTRLQVQVHEWKTKYEAANRALAELQSVHKALLAGGLSSTKTTADPSALGAQAASEFSQRMQRDQRFKRGANTVVGDENDQPGSTQTNSVEGTNFAPVVKIARSQSPIRSPLGTLRNDANSPIRLDTLNMAVKKKSPVKRGSGGQSRSKKEKDTVVPMVVGVDENSTIPAQPYSTRLRAMLVK